MTELSNDEVVRLLDYNPQTGIFRWRIQVSNAIGPGCIAGTISNSGYVMIGIRGKQYPAHRLAWYITYGVWIQLDHKDRDRANNILDNLRPATTHQNGGNRQPSGPLGVKGVTRRGNKYIAQITVMYKNHYLGIFNTLEEAAEAYNEAAKVAFGDFADAQ